MKKQIISCVIGIVSASQDLVAGQQQLAGLPLQNSLTANVASQPIDKQHLIYNRVEPTVVDAQMLQQHFVDFPVDAFNQLKNVKTFDTHLMQPLTNNALTTTLLNRTIYGVTAKGGLPYAMYFSKDGVYLKLADGRSELGSLKMDNLVHSQWSSKISAGKKHSYYYVLDQKNPNVIYKVRANGLQRFTALILSDGDKEQFLQKTVQADKVLQ